MRNMYFCFDFVFLTLGSAESAVLSFFKGINPKWKRGPKDEPNENTWWYIVPLTVVPDPRKIRTG